MDSLRRTAVCDASLGFSLVCFLRGCMGWRWLRVWIIVAGGLDQLEFWWILAGQHDASVDNGWRESTATEAQGNAAFVAATEAPTHGKWRAPPSAHSSGYQVVVTFAILPGAKASLVLFGHFAILQFYVRRSLNRSLRRKSRELSFRQLE